MAILRKLNRIKRFWTFLILVALILVLLLMFINVIQVGQLSLKEDGKRTVSASLRSELESQQRVNETIVSRIPATIKTYKVKKATSKTPTQPIWQRFNISSVAVVGNDFSQELGLPRVAKYIFFVPHCLTSENAWSLKQLKEQDVITIEKLVNFLEHFPAFEAATGLSESVGSLNKSLCRYQIHKNTLVLRNIGNGLRTNFRSNPLTYQECNFVDTAFLMRKEVFLNYGFQNRYGISSLTEFFVRYQRTIKIAKLGSLFLSSAVNYIDRGILNKEIPFPDYFLFGEATRILRIIYPDKITWTQCAISETLCHEVPLVKKTGPETVLPICCNEVLDEILNDFASSLKLLNREYFVSYGTLLGAVRNNAIIPWTRDVDLALSKEDIQNKKVFEELRAILKTKYYIGYYEIQDRALPHFMPSLTVDTSVFFTGPDDMKGKDDILYSERVLSEMNKMFPIRNSWLSYAYLDFYDEQKEWMVNASAVTINGRQYPTYKDPVGFLKIIYGDNYLTPVKE